MIYLDSAAIVKLVHTEGETEALATWLYKRPYQLRVVSALAQVEVSRAIQRWAPAAAPRVAPVLATLYQIEISAAVRQAAAAFTDPLLRSLDAIHLATAIHLGREVDSFVTYDKRLLAAATAVGLHAVSPSQ